jgi:8-amino-7-oxononanoate synthase
VLDFTSVLYLGMWHPSGSLRPWARLTTGVPAALAAPPGSADVARELAALQGCQRGSVAPSTLHLFWDLFESLSGTRSAIFMDEGLYPVGRWGVERAASRGVPVMPFQHHDPGALLRRLNQGRGGRRPVVVADGLCPACGGSAPIADYLEIARARGGRLVLDDTQALGILGHSPDCDDPYGRGGGGSLRRCGAAGSDVILVSSLAKGFGVPVAVISGAASVIGDFEAQSQTRVHTSPPAVPVISAAQHALQVNQEQGDAARRRLARLVIHFRRRVADAGLHAAGGLFPVQTIHTAPGVDVMAIHARLLQLGVRTVLGRGRECGGARIRFLINARHRGQDIERAVDALSLGVDQFKTRVIHTGACHETFNWP